MSQQLIYGHGVFHSEADAQNAMRERIRKIANGTMTEDDWRPQPPQPPQTSQSLMERNLRWEREKRERDWNEKVEKGRKKLAALRESLPEWEVAVAPRLAILDAAEQSFPGIRTLFFELVAAAREAETARQESQARQQNNSEFIAPWNRTY